VDNKKATTSLLEGSVTGLYPAEQRGGRTPIGNKRFFLLGIVLGGLLMFVGTTMYNSHIHSRQWGNSIDPNTKITEIYSLVNQFSILPFDKTEMLENMYRGFLDGVGDPYTQYFDREALQAFHVRTEGVYVGIGVMVSIDPTDRTITIAVPFQGAPAAEAGLFPGDKIIAVEGVDVVGRPLEEVTGMIKGPEGTTVRLTILRPYENSRFDVDVMRSRVEIPTVFHEMYLMGEGEEGQRIGYIRIEGFERVTWPQFQIALSELVADDMEALILDLRNNPGGLLDVVSNITNLLLPEGVITFTENVRGERNYFYSTAEYLGLPIILLVNERSASASEVLSGAIQDTGTGIVVGAQTFGKGIVQNLLYLSDGSAIKLTVAKYFTPSGASIHGIGVIPNVHVPMEESLSRRIGQLELEEDVQLQAALVIMQSILR